MRIKLHEDPRCVNCGKPRLSARARCSACRDKDHALYLRTRSTRLAYQTEYRKT